MTRILVVEDEPAIAELLAINLRHAGYEVALAADAVQAQAAVDRALPDLVLLDWMLPGQSGLALARLWRGDQSMEGAIYAETIPFDETRDYVKKVMSNTMHYARQFDAPQRPLKQRLGIIAGKTADNQQAIPDEQ